MYPTEEEAREVLGRLRERLAPFEHRYADPALIEQVRLVMSAFLEELRMLYPESMPVGIIKAMGVQVSDVFSDDWVELSQLRPDIHMDHQTGTLYVGARIG